ncbi:MAG: RNA polymerase sigma factor [Spirochaetes bacterium]|nr:RNA polymerase sigma factor [Spirochaetota bacterium]
MSSDTLNFNDIFQNYRTKILNFLSRTAGNDHAEDIAQEVFIKVSSSINSFRNESAISTWIYRIAFNTAMDFLRKQKNKPLVCDLADKKLFYRQNSDYLTDEFRLIQDEMNECICSYIKQLSPKYKAAVILREYEGMSSSQISEVLGIKPESAKTLLKRARKLLRNKLEDACDFYYNEMNILSCEKK